METGRVNQKRRTRAAIVDAAQRLLDAGTMPTVADAAAEAEVGRTTAYRYFPTQESLLLEVTITAAVSEVEDLVATPPEPADVPDRLVEVLQGLLRHTFADAVRYRTAMSVYQQQWLAAAADGDAAPIVREGRRTRWLDDTLAPIADQLTPADRARLVAALSMLTGAEAMVALTDVAHLDEDAALAVADWAARALIAATLDSGGNLRAAIDEAGGYPHLAQAAAATDPDLA